jgi:hypothetical protein
MLASVAPALCSTLHALWLNNVKLILYELDGLEHLHFPRLTSLAFSRCRGFVAARHADVIAALDAPMLQEVRVQEGDDDDMRLISELPSSAGWRAELFDALVRCSCARPLPVDAQGRQRTLTFSVDECVLQASEQQLAGWRQALLAVGRGPEQVALHVGGAAW